VPYNTHDYGDLVNPGDATGLPAWKLSVVAQKFIE